MSASMNTKNFSATKTYTRDVDEDGMTKNSVADFNITYEMLGTIPRVAEIPAHKQEKFNQMYEELTATMDAN